MEEKKRRRVGLDMSARRFEDGLEEKKLESGADELDWMRISAADLRLWVRRRVGLKFVGAPLSGSYGWIGGEDLERGKRETQARRKASTNVIIFSLYIKPV